MNFSWKISSSNVGPLFPRGNNSLEQSSGWLLALGGVCTYDFATV